MANRASATIASRLERSGYYVDEVSNSADEDSRGDGGAGTGGKHSQSQPQSMLKQLWNGLLDDILGPKKVGK